MNTKASNAVGGKTARACDSCLIKRARWFCAADDAFLCQSCDGAVHSANQLASRHERVRLETASCKAPAPAPAWHTKKARTPRQGKSRSAAPHHQLPVVPEMSSDEADDQLFSCRVPVLDMEEELGFGFDDAADHELNLDELLSTCCDDVESFLGHGDGIEGLMMMDHEKSVKIEDSCKAEELNWDMDFNFAAMEEGGEEEIDRIRANNKLLRLNYEAVIAAWASQGSPWTDGIRPHYCNLDDLIIMGESEEWGSGGGKRDAGREARVSRYREKRRTRLFSKKIRYEVRKLNAEKRPRMKGRFVKRTNFLPPSSISMPNYHLINKA